VQSGALRVVGPDAVEGWLDGGNFCDLGNKFTVYYAIRFDAPISSAALADGGVSLRFDAARKRTLRFKAAVSYVSERNARLNLAAEIPGWDFAAVRGAAAAGWNRALGKIEVDGGSKAERTIFYTALYHAFLHPNVFSDVNGDYVGFDRAVRVVSPPALAQYANFSGWDVYRTQIQLLAALFPERASDMMQSLIVDADQCGGLPRWPYNNDEAAIMVGDPASVLLANAHAFGARGFDMRRALYWMKRGGEEPALACNGRRTRPGLAQYLTSGYVPEGVPGVWGSASTTLEYAVADYAVSRFAASLGDADDARAYLARSAAWRNLLDGATGYLRPKDAAGRGLPGFDPASGTGFVEGNAAQYTWMVPFDFPGLVSALGGPAAVNARLDEFFTRLNVGENFPYFWVGNEPGFATPWLYNWTGAPAKTADVIRRSRDEMFSAGPGGLPGNDDLGALSAWYVWAALGLYPAIPGVAEFSVNPPLFPEARLDLGGRRPLKIVVAKRTRRSSYIESLTLDRRPVLAPSMTLAALKSARELRFILADRPAPWGVDAAAPGPER
jgi:predicted alpha-1,2-mannosidase